MTIPTACLPTATTLPGGSARSVKLQACVSASTTAAAANTKPVARRRPAGSASGLAAVPSQVPDAVKLALLALQSCSTMAAPTTRLDSEFSDSEDDDTAEQAVPVFVKKLKALVDDPAIDSAVWSADGGNVMVEDPERLGRQLVKYFKASKLNSFVRQLHFYGFKKIGGTRAADWIYTHKHFQKDGRQLHRVRRKTSGPDRQIQSLQLKVDALQAALEDTQTKLTSVAAALMALLQQHPATGASTAGGVGAGASAGAGVGRKALPAAAATVVPQESDPLPVDTAATGRAASAADYAMAFVGGYSLPQKRCRDDHHPSDASFSAPAMAPATSSFKRPRPVPGFGQVLGSATAGADGGGGAGGEPLSPFGYSFEQLSPDLLSDVPASMLMTPHDFFGGSFNGRDAGLGYSPIVNFPEQSSSFMHGPSSTTAAMKHELAASAQMAGASSTTASANGLTAAAAAAANTTTASSSSSSSMVARRTGA